MNCEMSSIYVQTENNCILFETNVRLGNWNLQTDTYNVIWSCGDLRPVFSVGSLRVVAGE